MSAPPSSLLLLPTLDAGADQAPDAAQPEQGAFCRGCGRTVEDAAAPEAKTGEEVMAEAKERLALVLGFQKHEAAILEANLKESVDWISLLDTPSWRSSPWQLKLATVFAAAARGAVITSACSDRSIPRDYETVKRALDLLAHEMNHPLAMCGTSENSDANEYQN